MWFYFLKNQPLKFRYHFFDSSHYFINRIIFSFLNYRDSTNAFSGHSNFALSMLKQYEIGVLPPNERMYRYPASLSLSCEIPE